MKKIKFKAYDNVNQTWYFSEDYKNLSEFFSFFDNVQHTIELVSDSSDVLDLIESDKTLGDIESLALQRFSENKPVEPKELLYLIAEK